MTSRQYSRLLCSQGSNESDFCFICTSTISRNFIEEKLGNKYVENRTIEFAKSYEETGPGTPVFFILSPGVDPLKDVEALGKKLGFTMDNRNFHNVSLGQVCEIG